jgi:hypothetical protein
MRILLQATFFVVYLVHTDAGCVARADSQYCSWSQIYTYYKELDLSDWVSVDTPSLCGSCSPGMFYSPMCGSPNQERWDGCGSCWPGTYSLGGNRQGCSPCPAGTFSGEFQSTACTPCPYGTFGPAPGVSQCVKCPIGTFHNGTGAADSSVCQGPAIRSFVETVALFLPIGQGS